MGHGPHTKGMSLAPRWAGIHCTIRERARVNEQGGIGEEARGGDHTSRNVGQPPGQSQFGKTRHFRELPAREGKESWFWFPSLFFFPAPFSPSPLQVYIRGVAPQISERHRFITNLTCLMDQDGHGRPPLDGIRHFARNFFFFF